MSKPILLCDVDGVAAVLDYHVHHFAQEILGRALPTPSTWGLFEFDKAMEMAPSEADRFFECALYYFDPSIIELCPVFMAHFTRLQEVADIVFVTAPWKGMEMWMPAREALLEPLGCEVIFTHAKHLVVGDYLLDDKASTIIKGGQWKGLLWDAPPNRNSPCQPPAVRVKSWEQVIEILKGKNK